MRKLRAMEDVLSRGGRYHEIKPQLKVKEVTHNNSRYIICLNPEEAEYDRQARSHIIEKLSHKLQRDGIKSLIGNAGYRRYLKVTGTKATINQSVVKGEERYDGKYVLKTNNDELTAEEIALAYKDLWKVERAFRELKSGLDLRPVFHWKESRVRGHVMVCFLAFLLESTLRRQLKEKGSKVSYTDRCVPPACIEDF